MNDTISIFIAPPTVAKALHGRYICLIEIGDTQKWYAEDSLVELSAHLTGFKLDWPFVENDLLETGVFTHRA